MPAQPKLKARATYYFAFVLALCAAVLITYWATQNYKTTDVSLLKTALLVGIIAQLVDGALGMAYGVTAATFLLWSGVPPAIATASVHIAEVFTTAASGLSHWHYGNVKRRLFLSLLIPGILGGLAGVYVVVNISGDTLKPIMAGYLLLMGLYIISKALRKQVMKRALNGKQIAPLALFGGFVDSVGGGGWGPVVTTTLLGSGHEPKTAIGSVNAAEFFITLVTGFSFALFIGVAHWEIPAGLLVGGIITAPFAAYLTSKLPTKYLMLMIGILISILSAITVFHAL